MPSSSERRGPASSSTISSAVSRRASKSLPPQTANNAAELRLAENRDGLIGHGRRLHLGHRTRDVLFQPAVGGVQAAVAVVGGGRLPAAEEERDPGLNVLAAGLIKRALRGGRQSRRPPQGSLDGAGRPVAARRYRSKERARSSSLGVVIASPVRGHDNGTRRSLVSAPALGAARRMRGAKRRFRGIGATVPHRIRWCLSPSEARYRQILCDVRSRCRLVGPRPGPACSGPVGRAPARPARQLPSGPAVHRW